MLEKKNQLLNSQGGEGGGGGKHGNLGLDRKTLSNAIEVMMMASVWDVLIVSLDFHVLCQLTQDSSTKYISDINECAPNGGWGPCAQICTNTPGSFSCSCKARYNLSGYASNGKNSNGHAFISSLPHSVTDNVHSP